MTATPLLQVFQASKSDAPAKASSSTAAAPKAPKAPKAKKESSGEGGFSVDPRGFALPCMVVMHWRDMH